jgi:hypothetical protein
MRATGSACGNDRVVVGTDNRFVQSLLDHWQRPASGKYGKTQTDFAALDDLIASKLAAGRPRDLGDLDAPRRAGSRRRTDV